LANQKDFDPLQQDRCKRNRNAKKNTWNQNVDPINQGALLSTRIDLP
jgi:hypothetical protein